MRGTLWHASPDLIGTMLPAITSHYVGNRVGNRLRLPVDILCLPFAAICIDNGLRAANRWRTRGGTGWRPTSSA